MERTIDPTAMSIMAQILEKAPSDRLKANRDRLKKEIADGTAKDDDINRATVKVMTRILRKRYDLFGCSFCDDDAVYSGDGQDGDFYCEQHVARAPGAASYID